VFNFLKKIRLCQKKPLRMSEAAGRTRAAERRQTESIPPLCAECTNRGAAGRHLCSFRQNTSPSIIVRSAPITFHFLSAR
jgi:hypothetical protein